MSTISGKLAIQAIEQAAKRTEKDVAKPLTSEGGSPFQKMMEGMNAGQEMADLLGIGKDSASLSKGKMESISAANIDFDPAEMNIGLEEPKGVEKVVDMLSEVNKGQMQMDNLVNEILYSEKRFSNQELLAIQAHVFHFAQMSELTVKEYMGLNCKIGRAHV